MTAALAIIATVMLAAAAVAMSLRNLIHSALCLILSWLGIAAFYLWAGAEFVGFAQVLIYVGAVSMVVLFAVLLTRRFRADERDEQASLARASAALVTAGAVAGVLGGAVVSVRFDTPAPAPVLTVREIGVLLAGPHAAALLVAGVLLTVALIGAVVIAATDSRDRKEDRL